MKTLVQTIMMVLSALVVLFALYIQISMSSFYAADDSRAVSIRKFPYPYQAALAISNDIDETFTLKEFLTINEFLTTANETPVGKGLDLEIGASFYAKSLEDRFALLSGNPADKNVIVELIKRGYIDFIHSYNKVSNRNEIAGIIDTLIAADCAIRTWVNHADVSNNIGEQDTFLGDDPGQAVYHTDLTIQKLGCLFFWQGQLSGIIGQERPVSLFSFFDGFDSADPLSSFLRYTLSEATKYLFAVLGSKAYAFREYNQLVRTTELDDGQQVFEFQRGSYCSYGAWGDCATMNGFAHSIGDKVIRTLIENEGYAIVFTHLGKNDGFPYFSRETKRALRQVAWQEKQGTLYVTTTTKLLSYYVNRKYLDWNYKVTGDSTQIIISSISDPVRGSFIPSQIDLQGLTFYTADPKTTQIYIADSLLRQVTVNAMDGSGRKSIMINRVRLPAADSLYKAYKKRNLF